MKETNIREYAALMAEYGLTSLSVKGGETEIRMERTQTSVSVCDSPKSVFLPLSQEKPTGTAVCSPMVGVFYAAPSENAEPFVKVGAAVKKGDVLCIIEAMKLMNEIKAEANGTITEIYAVNGETVDFGKELFRIVE